MNIGNALRVLRIEKGLTQSQLAEKAGINEKYYGRIERNESSPTIDTIEAICKALRIDAAYLFSIAK